MQDFLGSTTEIHYGIRPVAFALFSPTFSSLVGSGAPTFLQGSADAVKAAIPLVQWHFGGGLGTPPFQRDFNAIISDLHALCIDAPTINPTDGEPSPFWAGQRIPLPPPLGSRAPCLALLLDPLRDGRCTARLPLSTCPPAGSIHYPLDLSVGSIRWIYPLVGSCPPVQPVVIGTFYHSNQPSWRCGGLD